jgi:signal transduction histidine kinase
MKKSRHQKKRFGLTFSLVLFVFGVIISAMLLAGIVILVLYKVGVFDSVMGRILELERYEKELGLSSELGSGLQKLLPLLGGLLQMFLFSSLLAFALTWFFGRKALKPMRNVISAIHQVADGDFNVQVQLTGVRELEALSHSFNRMTQELSSIEIMRSGFINDFSHEFKTPIGSIRGFAKLLQDEDVSDDEKREYIAIIIAESERLAMLSSNVLTLSKYENTEIIVDKTVFSLDEQIRSVIALTGQVWLAKGIDLQADMEEIMFEGNEDLTQHIWLNLLENAIKFSPLGGAIHIRLTRAGNRVVFSIQDEGRGIDEAAQTRIFDKFYQEDPSRSASGNGLGLTIVKRITELIGGTIEVQSALGQGSTFTVII